MKEKKYMQISKEQYDKLPKHLQECFTKGNINPCVKPIKLMSYLVTLGSRQNDIILDPFMGSGTTGISAKMLNRKFIGIEKEKEYIEIAKTRIEAEAKQGNFNL